MPCVEWNTPVLVLFTHQNTQGKSSEQDKAADHKTSWELPLPPRLWRNWNWIHTKKVVSSLKHSETLLLSYLCVSSRQIVSDVILLTYLTSVFWSDFVAFLFITYWVYIWILSFGLCMCWMVLDFDAQIHNSYVGCKEYPNFSTSQYYWIWNV